MKKNIFKIIMALAFCGFAFSACEEEVDLGQPDRLFRPIINTSSKGGNWVLIGWDNFKDVDSTIVELSTDSFTTVTFRAAVAPPVNGLKISGLEYDTKYQCRIRSKGPTLQSEWYVGDDITTDDFPTLLIAPDITDLLDNSVKLRWTSSDAVYDHITIEINRVLQTIPVTEEERAARQKIVNGLEASKSYVIKIYDSAGNYHGKKTYKTVAPQDFGQNVIDLRSLITDSAYTKLTQLFMDSVCNVYSGQKFTIVLDGGVKYKIPTLNVSKNVDLVITTGLSFAGNAIMVVNSNFGIMAAETVNSITISNVIFIDGVDAGKKKTDGNYGGTYLFNFNQAGGNLNSLLLSGCDIRYKRGVVRLQTTATLNTVTIENCLMDSIGGYGIVNIDNAASTVLDIVVKNSTISHADKMFVGTKPTISPNSLTMENVTTCYAPSSGIYIADFNGKTVPGGITFKKCLMGMGKDGAGVNGVRSSDAPLTIDQCYRASDLIWYSAAGAVAPASPLNDVLDCGLTTAELFASPSTVNFKITATPLVNKIGDPRWW